MRSAFGAEFEVGDGYLNTASIGVPPVAAADAVAAAVAGWRTGAGRATDFDAPVATARAAFGQLVGFDADRVAIGGSVSGCVSLVAAGLPPRSRVAVPAGEFTSLSWPFAARGHDVTEVAPAELGARAPDFDAVAVSVVQSADGAVADLDALRDARAAGTTVVLDATQSAGWFDADLSFADAVVAAGYKWLLSPRGVAWLAVHPDPVHPDPVHPDPGHPDPVHPDPGHPDREPPAEQAGWYAGADPWSSTYGLPVRLSGTARALDTSPAWYCHAGAAVALPWLAGLDRAAVHAHCAGLADRLRTGLGLAPTGSAIVAVARPGAHERLAAAGIVTSLRAGGARLAFHLYNTEADVEAALDALT